MSVRSRMLRLVVAALVAVLASGCLWAANYPAGMFTIDEDQNLVILLPRCWELHGLGHTTLQFVDYMRDGDRFTDKLLWEIERVGPPAEQITLGELPEGYVELFRDPRLDELPPQPRAMVFMDRGGLAIIGGAVEEVANPGDLHVTPVTVWGPERAEAHLTELCP